MSFLLIIIYVCFNKSGIKVFMKKKGMFMFKFMVTKVVNIQPALFHQYCLWFEFCEQEFLFCGAISRASDAFNFEFEFTTCQFLQEKIICFAYIYSNFTV